jgi:hypothetical protein
METTLQIASGPRLKLGLTIGLMIACSVNVALVLLAVVEP